MFRVLGRAPRTKQPFSQAAQSVQAKAEPAYAEDAHEHFRRVASAPGIHDSESESRARGKGFREKKHRHGRAAGHFESGQQSGQRGGHIHVPKRLPRRAAMERKAAR